MAKYIIDIPEKEMVYINIWKYKDDGKRVWANTYTTSDLRPYTASESYIDGLSKGQKEVWGFLKALYILSDEELYEIFPNGCAYEMTYSEAKAKYDAWKKSKEEIRVGDEVETKSGNKACVLYANPDGTQMFVFKADGTAAWWSKGAIHKTGKNHPEVDELLKKMRED